MIFKTPRLEIQPPERMILQITAMVVVLNLIQIVWRGVEINWVSYGALSLIFAGCFFAGQVYRTSGRSPRIGLALICTGLFPAFSASMVMFNYLLMPTQAPAIDHTLIWVDSLLGYHWPDVIAWAAANPVLNDIFRYAYMTTIPQIAVLIIVLGMSGRAHQLHVMMVSITITSILAIVFWGFFPSHGAKSIFTLSAEVEALASPIVDTAYGRDLLRMAAEGPGLISPDSVKGLIAFPSYHAVLAFTAVYAMRGVKGLFWVYLVINALILPATPLHGGHHLVDVPAGFVLFVLGTVAAERLVSRMYRAGNLPKRLGSDIAPVPEPARA